VTNADIISKVRKLLTTSADSGATPAEAQTALTIAQRLMAAHRVTERDVAAFAKDEARAAGRVDADDMVTETIGDRKIRQDGWVGMACAASCGCGIYHSWRSFTNAKGLLTSKKVLVAYGLPTDVAVCKELFVWAAAKMRADRKTYCRERGVPQSTLTGRSFADGWSHALLKRAQKEKADRLRSEETIEVERPSGPMALIVLGESEVHHERALSVKSKKLGLGKGRATRCSRNQSAYGTGGSRGGSVSLGRNSVR